MYYFKITTLLSIIWHGKKMSEGLDEAKLLSSAFNAQTERLEVLSEKLRNFLKTIITLHFMLSTAIIPVLNVFILILSERKIFLVLFLWRFNEEINSKNYSNYSLSLGLFFNVNGIIMQHCLCFKIFLLYLI